MDVCFTKGGGTDLVFICAEQCYVVRKSASKVYSVQFCVAYRWAESMHSIGDGVLYIYSDLKSLTVSESGDDWQLELVVGSAGRNRLRCSSEKLARSLARKVCLFEFYSMRIGLNMQVWQAKKQRDDRQNCLTVAEETNISY